MSTEPKRKRRRKNKTASQGRVHIVLDPGMREKLDQIAVKERLSVSFLGTYAIMLLMQEYDKVGSVFDIGGYVQPRKPGRRRAEE